MKQAKKSIFKSKTFWGAVISFVLTIYETILVPTYNLPHLPNEVYAILGALGFSVTIYGRAKAEVPVGLKDEYVPTKADREASIERTRRR